ncbi:MAG TPA: sulfite exporter TauE/SafE family protein [Candidatus Omnitrophota bacterium]|nr:sulfite exporter TauE/SafE family protein [Candidatus Omnitrophota bacterium]
MFKIPITFFLVGLSFGAGPCLASCGPLLLSYVAGSGKNVAASITAYFLFSLPRLFIYAILSLVIFVCGVMMTQITMAPVIRYITLLAGLVFILIGLLIATRNKFVHRTCALLQEKFIQKDKKTIVLLGVFAGIVPCAPLISVLSYIGFVAQSWQQCLLYGFSFGLGTVFSPLLVLAALGGLIPAIIKDNSIIRKTMDIACGCIIVILGILLIRRGI